VVFERWVTPEQADFDLLPVEEGRGDDVPVRGRRAAPGSPEGFLELIEEQRAKRYSRREAYGRVLLARRAHVLQPLVTAVGLATLAVWWLFGWLPAAAGIVAAAWLGVWLWVRRW
jgi:hypothetical protein